MLALGPLLATFLYFYANLYDLKCLAGHMLPGPGINAASERTN